MALSDVHRIAMCRNVGTLHDFEPRRDRDVEAARAQARAAKRFGSAAASGGSAQSPEMAFERR